MKDINAAIAQRFLEKAAEAGLSQEQAVTFLKQNFNYKTAADEFDAIVSDICDTAGVEKSAHAVAYIESLLKAAVENGVEDSQAIALAKYAMCQDEVKKQMPKGKKGKNQMPLESAKLENAKAAAYKSEFLKAAQDAGYTEGQSIDLFNTFTKQAAQPFFNSLPKGGSGKVGGPQDVEELARLSGAGQPLDSEIAPMLKLPGGVSFGKNMTAPASEDYQLPEELKGGSPQEGGASEAGLLDKLLSILQSNEGIGGLAGAGAGAGLGYGLSSSKEEGGSPGKNTALGALLGGGAGAAGAHYLPDLLKKLDA